MTFDSDHFTSVNDDFEDSALHMNLKNVNRRRLRTLGPLGDRVCVNFVSYYFF